MSFFDNDPAAVGTRVDLAARERESLLAAHARTTYALEIAAPEHRAAIAAERDAFAAALRIASGAAPDA